MNIRVLDSTLRDGAQGEGISFSVSDKINICRALDDYGVSYIEAGNPLSNPKDIEFFDKIKGVRLKNSKLCAFGSTKRKGESAGRDPNIRALADSHASVAVIFGKAWLLHVFEILKISEEENKELIYDTIKFLKSRGKEVIFDAEHFFHGYKDNAEYALSTLKTAIDAGADSVCLCDTNGGGLPNEIYAATREVCVAFSQTSIGIHAHNDAGCGVANTIMAVSAGADSVQGTFIGFGERCGNANLSAVLPNLTLKGGYTCDGDLGKLFETSHKIAEIANVVIPGGKPYIGRNAFTHKAGMHIDGVLKCSKTFEHIDPQTVGNERNFLISEMAGRGAIISKINQIAPELTKDSPKTAEILDKLKELEHSGYQFEGADASFELLVKKIVGSYKPFFTLKFYKTQGEFPSIEGELHSAAMIKIDVDGKTEITAATGNGPVNALDNALRRALSVFYPALNDMYLSDYKVRVLDQNNATASTVRVLIETADTSGSWTTVGVSNDIIEASLTALIDAIEYKLSKER